MLKDIHFLSDKSTFAAFHIPSSKIMRLSSVAYNLACEIKNNIDQNLLSHKYKVSIDQINSFIKSFENIAPHISEKCEKENQKTIERLTIHVSNDCNLVCTYCYANGGDYHREKKLMNEKTADDLVEFLIKTFAKIERIVFFGGEPFLNTNVIRRICTNFQKYSTVFEIPIFSVVTNGTILNAEIIELIDTYIETVVVSVDGPKVANNLHRKYKNGKGSFSKIDKFIKTIKKQTKALVKYEATYTNSHSDLGFSQSDISNYLKDYFQITGSVVDELTLDSFNERKADFSDPTYLEEIFFNLNEESTFLDQNTIDQVYAIAKGNKRTMCPVGKDIAAISTDGEILPCHVLLNETKFSLGSIYSDNIFINKEKYYNKYPFLKSSAKKAEPCISCWVKNLCGGCVLRWFYDFADSEFSDTPQPYLCEGSKEHFKLIVINLAKLQSEKQRFNEFVDRIAKEIDYTIC